MTETTAMVEAGPRTGAAEAGGAGTFYRIDVTRGTLREYWWSTRSPLTFPLAVLLFKVLRVKAPGSTDDPCVESLAPFEAGDGIESFPEDVRGRVAGMVREMEALGFEGPVVCRRIDDVLHATETYLVTMRARSGEGVGRAHVRVWRVRQPARVSAFVEFMTPLEGGGGVWSLASKPDTEAPPGWRAVRRRGASAADLWAAHRAELARAGRPAAPVADGGEARRVEEAHHAAVRDFHLRRGIFGPLTEADGRRVAAVRQAREAMAGAGGADADVLAEIERLGQRRKGWWGALLILAVSLALFVGLGKRPAGDTSGIASTWDVMAIVVGVLFVHELGHYVAMRVFGYRNLRMFFIPFFGAAVTGRHYNVPGWKKVVVSLMGPVPGIVLGVIVGLTGLVLKKALLTKVGLLALILNGFNLLPVLPLDGGWVAHALLFSRNYALDAAFRVLAAGAMIVAGFYAHQKFFTYIGIASLVSLPVTLKVARVVAGLRREGVRTTSVDDQTIPPEVAREIIGRVRAAFPRGAQTKLIARHTMHVFETLNARPPGWLATVGLGAAHAGAFAAALVFAVVLVLGERARNFDPFSRVAALTAPPKHVVEAASVRTWPEEDPAGTATAVGGGGKRQTVVASFGRAALAAGAFDAVRDALPRGARMRLFGETVLVSLPAGDEAGRKGVLRVMNGRTKDVFVAGAEMPAVVTVSCVAPDERVAEGIEEEGRAYFRVPAGAHLLPPWARRDGRSAEERARHLLARRTYARLGSAGRIDLADPAFKDLFAKMGQARREGDRAEVRRLEAKQRRLMAERREQAIRAIRDEGEGKVDVALLDRYVELDRAGRAKGGRGTDVAGGGEEVGPSDRVARELGPRMGQVEMGADGEPAAGAERESALTGGVVRNGAEVTFRWVRLEDAFEGAPAIVDWLGRKGCRGIKYAFDGGEWEEGD